MELGKRGERNKISQGYETWNSPFTKQKKKTAWQVTSSLGMKLILQAKMLKSTNILQVTIKK